MENFFKASIGIPAIQLIDHSLNFTKFFGSSAWTTFSHYLKKKIKSFFAHLNIHIYLHSKSKLLLLLVSTFFNIYFVSSTCFTFRFACRRHKDWKRTHAQTINHIYKQVFTHAFKYSNTYNNSPPIHTTIHKLIYICGININGIATAATISHISSLLLLLWPLCLWFLLL